MGGEGQRAPADLLVEETVRVGPGSPGLTRMRPMNGRGAKVLVAATRLGVQAAEARLKREACVSDAGAQCRRGTRFANATPERLGEMAESFLAANYQKKGLKARQEELLPELQQQVREARAEAEQGAKHPGQVSDEFKDEMCKRAEEKELVGSKLANTQRATYCRRIWRTCSMAFWIAGRLPPRVKGFLANIEPIHGAQPKIQQPYRLPLHGQTRLELREDIEVLDGERLLGATWRPLLLGLTLIRC